MVFRLHLLRVQNCKQYKYTEYWKKNTEVDGSIHSFPDQSSQSCLLFPLPLFSGHTELTVSVMQHCSISLWQMHPDSSVHPHDPYLSISRTVQWDTADKQAGSASQWQSALRS